MFNEYGVKGKSEGIISPEKSVKLACGVVQIIGNKIAISTDSGSGSAMVKSAIIAGILSGGAGALDFGEQPIAITRSGIKFYNLKGGVHISDNGKRIDILNSNGICPGMGIMTKLMESYDKSEEYPTPELVREVVSMHSYKLYYVRDIINNCKSEMLRFNILISINNPTVKLILLPLLAEMGCTYTIYKNEGRLPGKEFSEVVKNEGYHMGVYIDKSGEKLILCDGRGNILDDELFICLCAIIVFKEEKEGTFVAPADAPSVMEEIARILGGEILRSECAESLIMSKVSEMNREGLCTQFILRFDPVGAVIKIMDFLSKEKMSLENVMDMIPEFYIRHEEIPCDIETGKAVVKNLVEKTKNADTTEGIKVFEQRGWALVSQSLNSPYLKIVCEGYSAEMAEELMISYKNKILEML